MMARSLPPLNETKVVVVGVGNPLRNDDGAGPRVVELIEKQHWPVTTVAMQQLQVEFLEDVMEFDVVVIVDASIAGQDVVLQKVRIDQSQPLVSSHHLGIPVFLSLAKTIYHKDLDLYICSIPGTDFQVGQHLSETAQRGVEQAVALIYQLVMGKE